MAKLVPDGCPKFILTLPKVIFPSLAIILPGIGLNIFIWDERKLEFKLPAKHFHLL